MLNRWSTLLTTKMTEQMNILTVSLVSSWPEECCFYIDLHQLASTSGMQLDPSLCYRSYSKQIVSNLYNLRASVGST